MDNFKSTDSLFSRIKEDFSSYSSSGLLDEGRFYHYVKYILNYLGISCLDREQDFLKVSSYTAELPDNFQQLEFAYKCKGTKKLSGGVVMMKQTFDHFPLLYPDWHTKACADRCCKPPEDAIFNSYEKVMIERDSCLYEYCEPELLTIGNVNTKRQCSDNCANVFSNSKNTISIQNNKIYTNFQEGSIYLGYYAFPIDDDTGLPLIPDNVRIEKCIEDYIKYNLVKNIIINKESDLARLLSFYKEEYLASLKDAVYETKVPTFENMIKQTKRSRKKFDLFF